jgi:hypothetical protein
MRQHTTWILSAVGLALSLAAPVGSGLALAASEPPPVPVEVRRAYPLLFSAMDDALFIYDAESGQVRAKLIDLARVPRRLYQDLRDAGFQGVVIGNRTYPELDPTVAKLKGAPRGWAPGSTYRDLQGVYSPAARKVYSGVGKSGSASHVLHELGHAVGELLGYNTHSEVVAAQTRLYDRIHPYYRQGGPGGAAGCSELFAEAFATHYRFGPNAVAQFADDGLARFFEYEFRRTD